MDTGKVNLPKWKLFSRRSSLTTSICNLSEPILSTDVTSQLINIQTKYGMDHPYLCNSRFRHVLHQLPADNHVVLCHLARFLHIVASEIQCIQSDSDQSSLDSLPNNLTRENSPSGDVCNRLGELFADCIFATPNPDPTTPTKETPNQAARCDIEPDRGQRVKSFDKIQISNSELETCTTKHDHDQSDIDSVQTATDHEEVRTNTKLGFSEIIQSEKSVNLRLEIREKFDRNPGEYHSELSTRQSSASSYSDYQTNSETRALLRKIFSQLISDYRAIFQIETKLESSVHSGLPDFHEHRKRHEEEDDCPEDIKAMKVAYDDLSLECKAGRSMQRSERVARRQPMLQPCEMRIVKQKNDGVHLNNNHEETKPVRPAYGHQQGAPKKSQSVPPPTSRALDCMDCPGMSLNESKEPATNPCSCPRKRKEPQDSLHEHERKFSRSSSLELEKDDLRANMLLGLSPETLMAGTEDMSMNNIGEDNHVLKEVQEQMQIKKDNSEPELRKRSRRRKRQRKDSPQEFKENAINEVDETDNQQEDKDAKKEEPLEPQRKSALSFLFNDPGPIARRSSSPLPVESPVSPSQNCKRSASIGYSGEKADTKSDGCWVSERLAHIMRVETQKETMNLDTESPRSFHLLDSGRFIEENKYMDANRIGKSETEKEKPRLKQLTKQLSNLKKKIEEVEQQLYEAQGYRPSQQDKLNHPQLKTLLAEQSKLKKDIKSEKENAEERLRKFTVTPTEKSIERIRTKLGEILERMEDNRRMKNRPFNYQDMSLEQVFEEKLELQSLLRDYEKEFGHPETREEKDMMKEVYERYRVIKRMARRSSQVKSGDSSVDLVTIPEDEEIDLTLISPQHRINLQLPGRSSSTTSCRSSSTNNTLSRHDMDLPSFSSSPEATRDVESDDSGKLWHAMSREELTAILKSVREDKKIARRAVKEFEDRFKNMTGRRVTKEDREPLEKTYKVYKNSKSKVKLINALLAKHTAYGERIER